VRRKYFFPIVFNAVLCVLCGESPLFRFKISCFEAHSTLIMTLFFYYVNIFEKIKQ